MRRGPEDITLGATAGAVMLATTAAIALVIYAMLTVVHLVPSSLVAPSPLVAQDVVRLAY